MRGIFSVDGKFYSITSKILDLVIITILWILGCIPVVTFFTSTSSMYHTIVKCVRYERGKAFEDFKEAYKKNLKQGIGLTILYGAVGVILGCADYYVFAISTSRTAAAFVLSFALLIISILYIINVLWMIPVFSRFSNTFGNMLRLNYVIATRNIPKSMIMIFIVVTAVILFLAINELFIILPALAMLLISYLSEPGLHKYMPKQEEDNGDWRYGFH